MQIKRIKPRVRPDISIKRVAAYARVSSDKEAALHSVSAQISYYNEYISGHPGWDFAGVYADEGITGTKEQRPEFQRMLQDCRDGKIDLILTKSITRFARNTVILLETIRELKSLGIDVYFEKENLHSISGTGELMLTLLAMYAEEESRSASENQKWRIRQMFEEGRPNTGRMLGYYLKDGELTVIPEEAKLVQRIYRDYLSGMGYYAIAKQLNNEGVPTVRGHSWSERNINIILKNEKYTGDMILQKTFIQDFRTKKGIKNNGQHNRYFVENSHMAIIDKATFDAVQQETKRRRNQINTNTLLTHSQFSGLLTCANCGKHLQRRTGNAGTIYAKRVWICATYKEKGRDSCNMKRLSESILTAKTQEALQLDSLENITLRDYISEIICDNHQLTYHLTNQQTIVLPWENPSRKDSWTDEMKQQARSRAIERRKLHESD